MNRVAISGLGRIGRAVLKLIDRSGEMELVAVNDLAPAENLAYLLRHDTAYGRYYTSSQSVVDGPNGKSRRGRAAAQNFVPSSTGAALATTRSLPGLRGRFGGVAVRGPVAVGSLADVVVLVERETTVDEVNRVFREEAESERYTGILGVTHEPLVSSDVVGEPLASIVDAELTQVVDRDLVKVMSWYDNEWGYAAQMTREAARIAGLPLVTAATAASRSAR